MQTVTGLSDTRSKLSWTDYHQSSRRIVAKYNHHHGNYKVHDHDFVEIVVITAGTCRHQSVLGKTLPKSGDVFLLRPGAWHGYSEVDDLCLYNCCFDTALLGHELNWMADDPALSRFLWGNPLSPECGGISTSYLAAPALGTCIEYLKKLEALRTLDYHTHHGDHVGLLIQILSLISRNCPREAEDSDSKHHGAVTAALKLIDQSPTEEWTLTRLSSLVQVEPTYFVRLFREIVGLPPMAYLMRRRLELATQLLRQRGLTISDVAEKAGWLDANYFSRCFRKNFGMTPSRYRVRFREKS